MSLTQVYDFAVISIVDNGRGISPKLLHRLGQRGETYGKEGGSGLGLYHARTTVEAWNGQLNIVSTPNVGTIVTVMLPLAKAAKWFVEHLIISTNSIVVVLDDDVSIHQIWDDRIERSNSKNDTVEILHFSTPEELTSWVNSSQNKLAHTLFLVDYEILGYEQVGLDIIEDLGIQSQSILVTSHYEEPGLRARCERLGVQLILKGMAGFVPITIENKLMVDAILIDDDILVHLCWKHSFKEKEKLLVLFSTAEEFIREAYTFSKKNSIYIDVNLADGVRGEDVARQVFEMGFCNIYLATGYEASFFSHLTFIKGVAGKSPPL